MAYIILRANITLTEGPLLHMVPNPSHPGEKGLSPTPQTRKISLEDVRQIAPGHTAQK